MSIAAREWLRAGVVMGALCCAGCASDLYAPCNLDTQSTNRTQSACATALAEGDEVSCAIENYLQCDTNVCAAYQGSETFCTQACVTDADCEDGVCRDFNIINPGSARYCVAPDAVP